MIYTDRIKKALNICFDAHKNDYDKGGYPYVFHPFYLATQMDDEESIIVALLHDVIEDHPDTYSIEYLNKAGFNNEICDAIALLTHDKDIEYMEYISKISTNPIAKRVKIADLRHNCDSSRMNGQVSPKFDLYQKALKFLQRENV